MKKAVTDAIITGIIRTLDSDKFYKWYVGRFATYTANGDLFTDNGEKINILDRTDAIRADVKSLFGLE